MSLFSEHSDREARDAIRTALDRNLFVEAGAGTGKTTVLVDRVVNLFATATLDEPSQLVAITFTEAAAGELRDRIRTQLDVAASDPEAPELERQRCGAARRRIDEAVITTLHGFAQRILAEHPLEAGLPPRFEVDDGVLARVRFAQRWAAFLDDLYDDPTAADDLLAANALGLTSAHLLEVAHRFHDRWDRVVEVDLSARADAPTADPRALVMPALAAVALAGERAYDADDKLALHITYEWLRFLAELTSVLDGDDELEVLRALAKVTTRSPNVGNAKHWGTDKPEIVALLQAAKDGVNDFLDQRRAAVIEHLLPRLQAFTAQGVEERRRAGTLEFHDLLVHARNLLRSNADVRSALAARYRALLIDEFQDTDPIQLDIAFLLAAADPAAEPESWRDVELAPGKVVIVGDPKQSIYGFRGADITVWDATRARFGAGLALLGQNFRTVPRIIDWVNAVFTRVIGEGRPGAQPRYEALTATRPEIIEEPPVILIGGPEDRPIDELRTAEATEIARLIVDARATEWAVHDAAAPGGVRPVRYADVAVLLPTRTPLGHIERALDAHGVPYRIESRSLVWSTDGVRELMAILTAIDDPADDVAVLAALRSPGFACSDNDLLEWRAAGGRWDHRRDGPDDIATDHPVAAAMAALRRYHEGRNDVPADLLVEQVVRERRLVELTFAQRRPRDHWRRLRFVLDQARAFVEAGGRSLGELVAWANLQADEGVAVVETPAPEADDDAVRILTIHGSKGLEFPVVVLAGLGTRAQSPNARVAWGDERPEVSAGKKDARFTTTGWESAWAGANDAATDEGHRLLYVAATRARDLLVVGLHHKPGGGRSHASTIWQANDEAGPTRRIEPVEPVEQLALALEPTAPLSAVDDVVARRAAFVAAHDALAASTHAPRVLSATALAKLAAGAVGVTEDDDESDSLEDDIVEPEARPSDDGAPDPAPAMLRRGGTARGRAVHGVLQSVDFDDPADLAGLAELHAAAEGLTASAIDVAQLARSALDAPTVRAARAATRRWRELYVAAPLRDDRLLEGYIDLLYEDADGDLVVVDHKTDAARNDAEVDAAAERYRLQLAAYALAVELAVGRPVRRAVLVFARADGPAVEREVADLPGAVAEARALALA